MSQLVWKPDVRLEEKIDRWLGERQKEFLEDLKDLVAIPSVSGQAEGRYPFGEPCAKVLEAALDKAKQYGFIPENYEYYCGGCRMKGSGFGEIGLFSHLDVVPLGEGWEYPPLECTVKDGFLIGRGTGDNKGPAVAALYAMRFLKEQEISLKHDVLLYFGCNEEKGMEDIEYFVKTRKAPEFSLVPDTNFPVCYGEKGIFRASARAKAGGNLISFKGGSVVNVIPARAEAVIRMERQEEAEKIAEKLSQMPGIHAKVCGQEKRNVKAAAEGLSRHAAFPQGSVNAVHVLADALVKTGGVKGEAAQAVKGLCVLTSSVHGETTGIPFEDKETGKITCCGTVAVYENEELRLSFDIRYPSSFTGTQVEDGLRRAAGDLGFTLFAIEDSAPFFISPDRMEIQTLCRIADHVLGKTYPPYTMGGGTYARHLPNAVGFGPGLPDQENPFPQGRGQGHQPDECICFRQLTDGCKAYIETQYKGDKSL